MASPTPHPEEARRAVSKDEERPKGASRSTTHEASSAHLLGDLPQQPDQLRLAVADDLVEPPVMLAGVAQQVAQHRLAGFRQAQRRAAAVGGGGPALDQAAAAQVLDQRRDGRFLASDGAAERAR